MFFFQPAMQYSTLPPLMHFALPQWGKGRERGRKRQVGGRLGRRGESQKRGVKEKNNRTGVEQPHKASPLVNSPRDDKGWNRPLLHNSYVKCCRKGLKWAVIKAPLKPRACVFPQMLMSVTPLDYLNDNLWLPWQSKRVCSADAVPDSLCCHGYSPGKSF